MSVLHGEPGYKKDEFVDEMTMRARSTLAEMGGRLELLLRDLVLTMHSFQSAHYLITLADVRFVETRWLQDGRLLLTFGIGANPDESEFVKHAIVDTWVDDVLKRNPVPVDFRNEIGTFFRGMIWQFLLIKKHSNIDLREIRFGSPSWINERQLVIGITYDGRPFGPKTARID